MGKRKIEEKSRGWVVRRGKRKGEEKSKQERREERTDEGVRGEKKNSNIQCSSRHNSYSYAVNLSL